LFAEAEIRYWLALSMLKVKKRPILVEALLRLGPERLFCKEAAVIVPEFPSALQASFADFDDWEQVENELRIMKESGVRLITLASPEYPARLKKISDPPFFLYAKGPLRLSDYTETLGVVGTRQPTSYGKRFAESLAWDMASFGTLVVSGMARGIDMAAHKGALGAGGATVAVLGTGIDRCYPAEANKLYKDIGEKGLLVSEFPMGTGPRAYNFPRRNRIISGLSRGVLVVEAPMRSGAMMTARLALEQGRDLFALPGPVTSFKSKGPNTLIKQGALLVDSAGDILASWGVDSIGQRSPSTALSEVRNASPIAPARGDEALVFKALEEGPLSIDAIAAICGIKVQALGGILLEMELKGIISQGPGKIFERRF